MTKYNIRLKQKSVYYWFIVLVLGSALFNGCVTAKKATYLQEYRKSEYKGDYTPPQDYLIQTNDNLYINVSTPDPRSAIIFNPMGGGSTVRADESSAQLLSYPVQLDGTVTLPYVGAIEVAGKTISEARATIETVLNEYVADVSVTVRLINNYVSVLGEVRLPGMYPIYKDRLNIFQAIAMAGDVSEFGNRYEISIIRQTSGKSVVKSFDMTDKNIVDSEYYYIVANDIVYVKPLKGRFFDINTAPWAFALSTLSVTISIFILIQNSILIRQ